MVGIVIIGRNVGALLNETLDAARRVGLPLVYVDSGSTDASVARARQKNIPVVELDASQPYTAARARNAGAQFLLRQNPALEFFQFVDGDCMLAEHFVARAVAVMDADARVAVVCGQRRERFPDASVYNQLAALEWETPRGEILACGGDALVRVCAFVEVGGYDARLIAGEEPEMCLRLRRAGWKIFAVDADMTYHDARMTRFGPWWTRAARAGHAYAEIAWRHGRERERFWVHESASIWFWGAGVWLGALGLAKFTRGASLVFLLGYPLLGARIYARMRKRGWSEYDARLYALFCVLAKFPQLQGQLQFFFNL
jgi:GT2 family glycosyltransferase